MKAIVIGQTKENFECTQGLLKTFYLMLGGRNNADEIKEINITDNKSKNIELFLDNIEENKKHLEVIKEILFNSYTLINDAKASSMEINAGDPPEEYVFMARMEYVFFIMSVIELSKLFIKSDQHHFNLYSYINKLRSLKDSKGEISNIELINPDDYLLQLDNLNQEGIIENLRGLRNKVFAHTDKGIIDKTINYNISVPQLEKMLSVAFNIINDINLKLFNLRIEEFVPDTAVKGVLNILNKELKGIS